MAVTAAAVGSRRRHLQPAPAEGLTHGQEGADQGHPTEGDESRVIGVRGAPEAGGRESGGHHAAAETAGVGATAETVAVRWPVPVVPLPVPHHRRPAYRGWRCALVVDDVVQAGWVKVLSSRVTAPLRASIRPMTVAPVLRVPEVRAMTVPTKVLPVPRVAELPTCQKTLHQVAPLTSDTVLLEAVIRVEPAWKMKTELALFSPFRVRVPGQAERRGPLVDAGGQVSGHRGRGWTPR